MEEKQSDSDSYGDESASPDKISQKSDSESEINSPLPDVSLAEVPTEVQSEATTVAATNIEKQHSANNPNSPHDLPPIDGPVSDEEDNSWADDVSLSESGQEDYYDQEYDEETPTKVEVENAKVETKDPEKPEIEIEPELEEQNNSDPSKRIVMNCYCTEYDVVKKVARRDCKFKVREWPEDYDGAIVRG